MPSSRVLVLLGRQSLRVMCVHWPIDHAVLKTISLAAKMPIQDVRNTVIGASVCLVVTLGISYMLTLFIGRYCGFALGKSLQYKSLSVEYCRH